MLIKPNDKIYITGHQGLLGRSLTRNFRLHKYTNIITTNRSEVDFLDFNKTKRIMSDLRPDVVIISAAKVGGIKANIDSPVEYLLENLRIQNNLIESSWKAGVRRLLFIGSSCIYPKYSKQPITEEQLLSGKLEKTLEPYALAKIAGLKLCTALRTQYGFDAICIMPSNLYGPGDNFNLTNSHVLPSLIRRFHEAKMKNLNKINCWGSGNVYREFLYVDDLADACRFLLEKWNPELQSSPKLEDGSLLDYLNVGTGCDLSIRNLANIIAKIIHYNGEIKWDQSKPDGTPRKLLNVSRINNLGWFSKTTINKGIELTYNHFLDSIITNTIRL